jgi:hypothetical protein
MVWERLKLRKESFEPDWIKAQDRLERLGGRQHARRHYLEFIVQDLPLEVPESYHAFWNRFRHDEFGEPSESESFLRDLESAHCEMTRLDGEIREMNCLESAIQFLDPERIRILRERAEAQTLRSLSRLQAPMAPEAEALWKVRLHLGMADRMVAESFHWEGAKRRLDRARDEAQRGKLALEFDALRADFETRALKAYPEALARIQDSLPLDLVYDLNAFLEIQERLDQAERFRKDREGHGGVGEKGEKAYAALYGALLEKAAKNWDLYQDSCNGEERHWCGGDSSDENLEKNAEAYLRLAETLLTAPNKALEKKRKTLKASMNRY